MAHHLFQGDLRAPLAFEVIDPIDRHQRAGHVAGDRVENVELLTEALIPGRALDIEDSEDLLAGAQRHDHRLARFGVAAAEAVVIDRTAQDHSFAPAGDPSGDALVDSLLVAQWNADPYRSADPKALAFDEHDRGPARTHPGSEVFRRAGEERRGIARFLEARKQVLEERDAIVLLRALVLRVRHRTAVAHAHRE